MFYGFLLEALHLLRRGSGAQLSSSFDRGSLDVVHSEENKIGRFSNNSNNEQQLHFIAEP